MKKHFFAIVSLLLCALLFIGCSNSNNAESGSPNESSSSEPSSSVPPAFDLGKYKELVSECRSTINEAGLYVANAGRYEFNCWKASSSISGRKPDNIVDSAFEWLSENSDETRDTVDADYNSIRQQYKDIILIEIEGREAEEIDAAFRNMYDAYFSMYNLVISPSGLLAEFGTTLSDLASAIMDADESLSLFLD